MLAISHKCNFHNRCKEHHNPEYFGVLTACEGDGNEITRMDKLEEKLADATDKKAFAKRKQRKGRKNK